MAKNTDEKLNIQEAIKAFSKENISNAGINLFSVLGYDTSLQAPLDIKTYTEFKENYIDTSPSSDRFSEEKALTDNWKTIDILFQLTDESFTGQQQLFDSKVNPLNPQSYLCFAIELNKEEYSKSQIANITREINKLFSIPIIIIFKYAKSLTLSVINRRVNKRDNERDVLEKVTLIKDIFYEKPHRAHIEILFDMSLAQLSTEYTIYNFETLHKAWSEVLDTQPLNKRFYTELSNWYFWAIKTVVYPGYEMEAEKNSLFTKEDKLREHNAKNLIRLLTRLLFVWFIKEKDLIPEELFEEQAINDLITSFEPDKYYSSDAINKESKSIYYKAILQNLFFASLNAEQGKRAFRLDGQNQNATSLMRYQRFHKTPNNFVELIESKVPFMNGGLFECLDSQDDEKKGKKGGAIINYEDGFSDRKDNELFVPDYVFFGKEIRVDLSSEYDDKKKKDVTVNGIINILQKYKFTIAENTPVEEDIALDPELLGRVFENLLASYNPETKTNARKQTGSFYTPRPIVEYMVDESLKAYLKTKIKDAALSKGTLQEKAAVVEALETTLDQRLDNLISYNENEPEFTEEERFQILKYIDECKILDPACGSGAFPMGILQKMVYVIHKLDPQNDNWKQIQIQKISNDSKLTPKEKNELQKEILTVFDDNELDYARKLYLIENCIHGIDIQPIATQISRLRFFISLIVDQKVDEKKPNFGVRPLPNLENRFVTANSLIGLNDEQAYLSSKEIDELMLTLQKVRHDLFKAKTPKHKFELRQEDKRIRAELEQELLKLGFGKENAKLISTWDPYDKNRSAEFFDAEWMFGIKDGFDIVIGNPPYVKKQNISEKDTNYYNKNFNVAYKNYDLYIIFTELGYKLLNRNGLLSYIMPKKFITTEYGKLLKKFIYENKCLKKYIDFDLLQVFENATNYVGIFELLKKKQDHFYYYLATQDIPIPDKNDLQKFLFDTLKTDTWIFEKEEISSLFNKLKNNNRKLLEVTKNISQGLVTGMDKVFVLEERGGLYYSKILDKELNFKKSQIFKPLLKGKEINRYTKPENNYFVIYPYELSENDTVRLLTLNEIKTIDQCIYNYLMECKADLILREEWMNDSNFYAYSRNQNIALMPKKKVLTQVLSYHSSLTYDENGDYCFVGGGTAGGYTIIFNNNENILFYLGLLNSNLLEWFIHKYASPFQGGYYAYNKATLCEVPIPLVNTEQQKPIIELVEQILAAKKADNTADTSELEHKIDELVYKLYGLTEDELKIVEKR